MTGLLGETERVAGMLATTGRPVVVGPPFATTPAAPCYVLELAQPAGVELTAGVCVVQSVQIQVWCVPATGTDWRQLAVMADDAIAAVGAVSAGSVEPNPFADGADTTTAAAYRLTFEQ